MGTRQEASKCGFTQGFSPILFSGKAVLYVWHLDIIVLRKRCRALIQDRTKVCNFKQGDPRNPFCPFSCDKYLLILHNNFSTQTKTILVQILNEASLKEKSCGFKSGRKKKKERKEERETGQTRQTPPVADWERNAEQWRRGKRKVYWCQPMTNTVT